MSDENLPIGWEKAKIGSSILSMLMIPIVVAIIGSTINSAIKDKELSLSYIELAVSILREEPKKDTENLRRWAIDVVNNYSSVKLTNEAALELELQELPTPKELTSWIDRANKARSEGEISTFKEIPVDIQNQRERFISWWNETSADEKRKFNSRDIYQALTMASRLYRVEESANENKSLSLKWTDEAINYFEVIGDEKYLTESLLDKAAIYLEQSQNDSENLSELRIKGDEVLARAYQLALPEQKSDTLRIWSRFYYNLSRPRDLSENWNNDYLLISLDKIESAYKLEPKNQKNATQLARTALKAADNPPQDSDPAWTKKMNDTQVKLLETWGSNQENHKTPSSRIPALNTIGVLTLYKVHRTWEQELKLGAKDKAVELAQELESVAINAQREALSLLAQTVWQEDYEFDMYYDLARMQAVKCRIMGDASLPNSESECGNTVKSMTIAKRKASSIQLNTARQAVASDPILNSVPLPYRDQLISLLDSSDE